MYEIQFSYDWLEFTFTAFNTIDRVMAFLNLPVLQPCQHGKYGYRSMLKHPEYNIFLLFDGNENMGIHLSAAGHSLDFLSWSFGGMNNLLLELASLGRFTRLDLALDDNNAQYFNIPQIRKYLLKHQYVTKFKTYSFISSRKTENNQLAGNTIYLGKRESNVFIRIYDKQLEHNTKLPNETKIDYPITRWETELKHETADEFIRSSFESDSRTLLCSVLMNYFRLINNDASRASRCSTLKKYSDFLGNAEKASITKSKKILTIEEKKNWLWDFCSKSIALSNLSDREFLDSLVEYGEQCLTISDFELLE